MSPSDPGPPRVRLRAALLAVVAALALAGCNLAIGVDVAVDADGSGTLELAFRLDEDLAASLEADGFDATFGLEALRDVDTGWDVAVDRGDGLTVRVSAPFADQAELDQRVAALNEGIDVVEDGALIDDLGVTVADDGLVAVTGAATLVVPATTGATGDGVVFDGDDLQALLEEEGADILLAEVRVRMPGPVLTSDADVVDGSAATWTLQPGVTRELSATAMPASDRTMLLLGAAVLLGLVAAASIVALRRR